MSKNHAMAQKKQKLNKMNSGGKNIDAAITKRLFTKKQTAKVETMEEYLARGGEIEKVRPKSNK